MPRTLLFLAALAFTGCRKKPPEMSATPISVPPAAAAPRAAPPTPTTPDDYAPVYFDFDRAEIRPDQLARLQADLELLRADPDVILQIDGNCDERGTTDYNLALGMRRAESAKQWLVAHGVAASRIHTLSYGEERPVAYGHDESAWQQNRRDDLHAVGVEPGDFPPVADVEE